MKLLDRDISHSDPTPHDLLTSHLRKLDTPTLDDLSRIHGVEIFDFPEFFRKRTKHLFDLIGTRAFGLDNEWYTHINFLYQTWVATKTTGIDLPTDFVQSLGSYDSFMQSYCTNASLSVRSAFNFWIKWFTERIVHPKMILELGQPLSKHYEITQRGVYEYKGAWHCIPSNNNMYTYVEHEVIREVNLLTNTLKSFEADLFHATGSAALDGISQHRALLSARRSEEQGVLVKTGEYTHKDNKGQIPVGGTEGLENIYASAKVDSGYSTIRWFDEFPVVFGFKSDEVNDYLEHQYGWRVPHLKEVYGDGHKLGNEVPISLVRAIYTQIKDLDRLRAWAKINAPNSVVISIEAASLLRERSHENTTLYPNYPYKFGRPIITDWQELLNSPTISLP